MLPAVSTKPLTLPDEVELRTAKRARLHCHSDEASGASRHLVAASVGQAVLPQEAGCKHETAAGCYSPGLPNLEVQSPCSHAH